MSSPYSLYSERDRQRGYALNIKLVVLAYLTEGVIATASLIGAVIFAQTYGHGDPWLMTMMMLAPIGYAVVEVSRVPLALAVRTQASWLLRIAALLGVLCAAGVTVKSMSQLGEIMFRPRLMDVMHAAQKRDDAKTSVADLERRIADADRLVTQRGGELQAAERQLALATEKLGGLPEQKCLPTSGVTNDGRAWKSMKCSPDSRIAPLTASVTSARADRDAVIPLLASARALRAPLDRTASEQRLANATIDYKEAVLNSQLHSFTAMVFGKNPSDVSDGEIHRFLRIFVFLPAICTAFAATLVALAAVTRVKPDETLSLDDGGTQYILDPFAREVIRHATDAAVTEMRHTTAARPVLVSNLERKL